MEHTPWCKPDQYFPECNFFFSKNMQPKLHPFMWPKHTSYVGCPVCYNIFFSFLLPSFLLLPPPSFPSFLPFSFASFLSSLLKMKVLVAQLCPTLCHPMDCSPPGSSVHGIHQARILERVAMPFSRGSSQSRDQTQVSFIAGRFSTI